VSVCFCFCVSLCVAVHVCVCVSLSLCVCVRMLTAEEAFEVKVKPLKKGNEHVVKTTRRETVLSLKEKLEAAGGYPVNTQRLVLKGKALVNNKTIGDYDISEGTVVHLLEKAPEADDKEKVFCSILSHDMISSSSVVPVPILWPLRIFSFSFSSFSFSDNSFCCFADLLFLFLRLIAGQGFLQGARD